MKETETSCFKNNENKNGLTTSTTLYQCDSCDRKFSSGKALGGHKTSHRCSNNNLVPQPIIKKQRQLTVNNGIIKISWSFPHDHAHDQDGKQKDAFGGCSDHFIQKGTIKSSSLSSSPHDDDNVCKKHVCPVCDKLFPSNKSLCGHMRIHKKDCKTIHPPQNTMSLEQNHQEIDLSNYLPPKTYKTKKRCRRDIQIIDQECVDAAEILLEMSQGRGGKRLKVSTDAVDDGDQETRCDLEIKKQDHVSDVGQTLVTNVVNNEKKLFLRFKIQQPKNEKKFLFDLNELPMDDVEDQTNID